MPVQARLKPHDSTGNAVKSLDRKRVRFYAKSPKLTNGKRQPSAFRRFDIWYPSVPIHAIARDFSSLARCFRCTHCGSRATISQSCRQCVSPMARSARPLCDDHERSEARGWHELDVVFVTGDAYIDHPSFAMAILGRVLEAAGIVSESSANRIGIHAPIGSVSASRGCSMRSAPAT